MKLNYLTLSLLVLIIFISCVIMIYHQGRKTIINDIKQYNNHLLKFVNKNTMKEINEKFSDEVIENFLSIKPENTLKFRKIEVMKKDNKENPYGRKVLYIEGDKLNKIKDVFFGDIRGLILNKYKKKTDGMDKQIESVVNTYNGEPVNSYNISNVMYILPPEFMKFRDVVSEKEMENIEVKFLIQETQIVSNPNDVDLDYNKNPINITSSNEGKLRISIINKPTDRMYDNTLKAKVEIVFGVSSGVTDPVSVEFECPDNYKTTIIFNNETDKNTVRFLVDMDNFTIPTSTLNSDKNITLKVEKILIDYMYDDINLIYPTGLFYRPGLELVSSGDYAQVELDDWKLYISEDGSANEKGFINPSDEIRVFHKNIKDILQPSQPPAVDPSEKFAVDFDIEIDDNDPDQIKVGWEIPVGVDNHIYTFMFNFTPTSGKADDTFNIKDEKIAFDKTSYLFSSKRLFPISKYNVVMKTLRQDNGELLAEVNKDFIYIPDYFKKYHSHLFNSGKFEFKNLYKDGKLDYNNAEMVRTYFELSEFNKMKSQDDLLNTERKLKDLVSCSKNNLYNIKNGNDSTFSSTLSEEGKRMLDAENIVFNKKSDEIDKQIQQINSKINDIEKLKNKKKMNDDIRIKSLKSVNDNTILNMEIVDDTNKLVKINNNCLAFVQNTVKGDYGLKACNMFDRDQYFELKEINNLDEYNNLLAMNLNPIINNPNELIDFPFYILQPQNSTKCVSLKDSSVSIKPCGSDDSIRFKGYITNNECNI